MGLIRNTFILKNEVFDTGSDFKFKSVREFIYHSMRRYARCYF